MHRRGRLGPAPDAGGGLASGAISGVAALSGRTTASRSVSTASSCCCTRASPFGQAHEFLPHPRTNRNDPRTPTGRCGIWDRRCSISDTLLDNPSRCHPGPCAGAAVRGGAPAGRRPSTCRATSGQAAASGHDPRAPDTAVHGTAATAGRGQTPVCLPADGPPCPSAAALTHDVKRKDVGNEVPAFRTTTRGGSGSRGIGIEPGKATEGTGGAPQAGLRRRSAVHPDPSSQNPAGAFRSAFGRVRRR